MSEEKAVTLYQTNRSMTLDTMQELMSFGQVMHQSGMFPDIKSQAQAVVKIVAGRELGLPPLYSLRKIYVINGQVTLSADAMASLIKRSNEYDYQIVKLDDTGCSIQFTRNGQSCGPPSTFMAEDAQKAGLTAGNWVKFRRNMMFARALSNGARWYCPHIIGGSYTPDELGAMVNSDGEATVIEANTFSHGHDAPPEESAPPEDPDTDDLPKHPNVADMWAGEWLHLIGQREPVTLEKRGQSMTAMVNTLKRKGIPHEKVQVLCRYLHEAFCEQPVPDGSLLGDVMDARLIVALTEANPGEALMLKRLAEGL